MKPVINDTHFGSINIAHHQYDHDVFIGLDGVIQKRKKKLSKDIYGTCHIVSLEEAHSLFQDGATKLIIGNGQEGRLSISEEAQSLFNAKGCVVELMATPEAIAAWNHTTELVIGMFHVTC